MPEKTPADNTQALAIELQIKRLQSSIDAITEIFPSLKDLSKGSAELQEYVTKEITNFALSVKASKLDRDQLKGFFLHPYHLYKDRKDKENDWHLVIPRFIDIQLGWLEKVTESHNVFLINRYVDWLGEIPQALKDKIGMKDPLDVFLDGDLLVGKDVEKVREKYKHFIKGKDKEGNLVINKGAHFELLATLIKDGILPFIPRPVPKELLTERRCDFALRDYQKEGWEALLQYSNVGIFFPPSTGKTFFGMHVCTHIKPPHIIAVPSTMLVEQWKERIELYTDLKLGEEVDVFTYQSAIKYGTKKNYNVLMIDEVHHLPANEFSKLAVIPRKITVGLSATPQREDGREEFIFALTGRPVGMAWDKFKQLKIIQSPPMHVWIVKNEAERLKTLGDLLAEEKKTIIFCDSIATGAAVAKRYGIPHVYGVTKDKLTTIQNAPVAVVSRVGDEGLSLPEIERVIEISWLFGSRRQELQRFTRLLHGQGTDGEGHIIMTGTEYQHDHKRLFGIMDRGFKIVLHREGVSDKMIHERAPAESRIARRASLRRAPTSTPTEPKQDLDESKYPLLKYPGIKKIVNGLRRAERKIILFLIDPVNQNQSFSKKQLMLSLGYTGDRRFEIEINGLIKAGYVASKEGRYNQNFSKMVS